VLPSRWQRISLRTRTARTHTTVYIPRQQLSKIMRKCVPPFVTADVLAVDALLQVDRASFRKCVTQFYDELAKSGVSDEQVPAAGSETISFSDAITKVEFDIVNPTAHFCCAARQITEAANRSDASLSPTLPSIHSAGLHSASSSAASAWKSCRASTSRWRTRSV